jgi:hypothetical protein
LSDLLDAAQRKRADDAIEGAVLKGELFTAQHPPINFDSYLLDPPSCPAIHPDVRLNNRDLANVVKVARQIEASAKADFQNIATCVGEQLTAIPGYERSVQPEIAQERDDHLRIEAHYRLLFGPSSTAMALKQNSVGPTAVARPRGKGE